MNISEQLLSGQYGPVLPEYHDMVMQGASKIEERGLSVRSLDEISGAQKDRFAGQIAQTSEAETDLIGVKPADVLARAAVLLVLDRDKLVAFVARQESQDNGETHRQSSEIGTMFTDSDYRRLYLARTLSALLAGQVFADDADAVMFVNDGSRKIATDLSFREVSPGEQLIKRTIAEKSIDICQNVCKKHKDLTPPDICCHKMMIREKPAGA
jgi:hypothetical protein